jgi:hypothetical protein
MISFFAALFTLDLTVSLQNFGFLRFSKLASLNENVIFEFDSDF